MIDVSTSWQEAHAMYAKQCIQHLGPKVSITADALRGAGQEKCWISRQNPSYGSVVYSRSPTIVS